MLVHPRYGPAGLRLTLIVAALALATGAPGAGRAEEPPSIDLVFPADGTLDVSTGARIWVWGPTLAAVQPVVSLVERDTGIEIETQSELFDSVDFSAVDRDRDEPAGFVGDTGYRYLHVTRPREPLKAGTSYVVRATAPPFSEAQAEFRTAERAVPNPAVVLGRPDVRRYKGGSAPEGRRVYTLVEFDCQAPLGVPLRFEIRDRSHGAGEPPATFVLWKGGPGRAKAVIPGEAPDGVTVRAMTLLEEAAVSSPD